MDISCIGIFEALRKVEPFKSSNSHLEYLRFIIPSLVPIV